MNDTSKIEPLYDDDKINDAFLGVGFAEYAADAFSTALDCAKSMRDRYETERAAQAIEIATLKARPSVTWQPIGNNISVYCECGQCYAIACNIDGGVMVSERTNAITLLLDTVRLCKMVTQ